MDRPRSVSKTAGAASIINTNLTRHRNDKFGAGGSKEIGKTVTFARSLATLIRKVRNCFQARAQ